jgi:hypothetical protein
MGALGCKYGAKLHPFRFAHFAFFDKLRVIRFGKMRAFSESGRSQLVGLSLLLFTIKGKFGPSL